MTNDWIRDKTGCPNCGAKKGEKCVTVTGQLMPVLVHAQRKRWAYQGWVFRG